MLPVFGLPLAPLLARLLVTWGVTRVEDNFLRAISEKYKYKNLSIPVKYSTQ